MHHGSAYFFFRCGFCPFANFRIGQRVEPVAHAACGQHIRKYACGFHDRGELIWKGNLVDFVMRKIAALAAHTVVFKLHVMTHRRARVGPPGQRPHSYPM